MTMNHLRSALNEDRFVCSAELVLGRDHTVPQAETFVRDASQEPDGIKVISLTTAIETSSRRGCMALPAWGRRTSSP